MNRSHQTLKSSYGEKIRQDPTRPFGLAMTLLIAVVITVSYRRNHHLIFLILAIRYWVMSVFLSIRLPAEAPTLWHHRLLAYVSKCIPALYNGPAGWCTPLLRHGAQSLILSGAVLSTLAQINLGRQFGVSPAKRGVVCRTGLYRWVDHPIYWGYFLVELGGVFLNPHNAWVFAISMSLLFVRASIENTVIRT